jgi:hypothetical protein
MVAPMTDGLIRSVATRVRIPERRTDATDVVIPEIGSPVSWDQLDRCEVSLGFGIPVLIRRLYLEIGNGGFGPGYGIFAIPKGPTDGSRTIVRLYQEHRTPSRMNCWEWPVGLLPVCDWGCLIRSHIYTLSPEQPVFTSTEYGVQPTRWTLESWLSDWASNVDLWEVMTAADPGFAPHHVTGQLMEYRCG